ncbi:LacI family DNA-binding transcriptional regulator [Gracilibacillus phocaeensis]|uniref:LacI family DNA-binding transcriptional regulator n=1 Tax=Gracilibacillus phocaeensis TaxID=2042304 RepID=UPI00102F35EB|nr:LacI family DNA-binding transcriptional regulator [Gracilibacillus phocaeensis]
MNKKTTIKDVAKHAQVSSATVSYVLNDVKKVSDKTRNRVLQAMEELNYYPDYTAVSLSKNTSKLIGVMLPLTEDSPLSVFKDNLYYNEFVSGVEYIARNHKFDTLITGVGSPEECRKWIKRRNLHGVIFLGEFPDELHHEMKNLDIPIVLIDTYENFGDIYRNVKVKDSYGGYLATKHLLDSGHKDIAFVATSLSLSPVDVKRYQGYVHAHKEAGVQMNKNLIYESKDITFDHGVRIGEAILNNINDLTGIVTVSDILAIGIMKALQQNGRKVPEDYSIVGFDDLSISQYVFPGLTTVRQDILEKGKKAAEILLNNVGDIQLESNTIELPVSLIIRHSTQSLR